MPRLTIRRKGYTRKGFTATRKGKKVRVRPSRVSPSTFQIRDRGRKGRGPRVIPMLHKGSLGVRFSQPEQARRMHEAALARRIGERKVQGKLSALAILNKRTNPAIARKAAADRHWIAAHFQGKKMVRAPLGLKRRR